MLPWIADWESRRILKLRLKLWWHFKAFWFECPYVVRLVFRHKSAPWPNYWAWVWVLKGHPPCEIGPLEQWSWADALKLAGDQYRESLLKDVAAGKNMLVDTAAPSPVHQMQFSLLVDSNYRVQCTCGWLSEPSPKGHMCQPENCADCGKVVTEWEGHVKEALAK